jgi:hypothetical protein
MPQRAKSFSQTQRAGSPRPLRLYRLQDRSRPIKLLTLPWNEEESVATPQADRKVGKIVLDYLLVTHDHPRDPDRFPLTGGYVQRVSRKLGCPVGEHRALRIIRLLERAEVIERAGSYRQAYRRMAGAGCFRVQLYRLSAAVRRLRPAASKASVRRRRAVKAWWKHGMFGFGVRSYPRWLPKQLRAWQEPG